MRRSNFSSRLSSSEMPMRSSMRVPPEVYVLSPPHAAGPAVVTGLAQDEAVALPGRRRLRSHPEALGIAAPAGLAEPAIDVVVDAPQPERLSLDVVRVAGGVELGPEPPAHQLASVVADRALVVEDRRGNLLDLQHALVRSPLERVSDDVPEALGREVTGVGLEALHRLLIHLGRLVARRY